MAADETLEARRARVKAAAPPRSEPCLTRVWRPEEYTELYELDRWWCRMAWEGTPLTQVSRHEGIGSRYGAPYLWDLSVDPTGTAPVSRMGQIAFICVPLIERCITRGKTDLMSFGLDVWDYTPHAQTLRYRLTGQTRTGLSPREVQAYLADQMAQRRAYVNSMGWKGAPEVPLPDYSNGR